MEMISRNKRPFINICLSSASIGRWWPPHTDLSLVVCGCAADTERLAFIVQSVLGGLVSVADGEFVADVLVMTGDEYSTADSGSHQFGD
jgi:hypothetical protein